MKVTLNWLKEFVEIDLTPQELGSRLTHAGLEVESIRTLGAIPDSVITVKIEKIEKHPKADRLTLCEVNVGAERRTIVCGAKNMKEGDVVALAQPGTLLPDGKKIERSKIRDVVSDGMLCSEKELGLAEDSEGPAPLQGLLILPSGTPIGKPLTQAIPISDTVFEINVTPNRSDCLSIIGIAREVAAITGRELKSPSPQLHSKGFSLKGMLSVDVKDPEYCPRYTARMIRGVKIGPSPQWVQFRLKSVGLRPINNVVDATNYVMMETGQPLHAFDATQIAQGVIQVRRLKDSEKFKTLDELERHLLPGDLLIADPEKVLAVAGVMGGLHSGVTEATQALVLESAYFQPSTVRRTSKRLSLATESSYRFERGVDPNGVRWAGDRLAELILDWAGGEISQEVIDTAEKGFPPKTVSLRPSRLNSLLGVEWDEKKIESILGRLQLKPQRQKDGAWRLTIPTYRRDLEREVDLIEEVARIAGYDQIPLSLPSGSFKPAQDFDESSREKSLKAFLKSQGFSEAIHYGFCSEKEILKAQVLSEDERKGLVRLANPISEELAVMRPTLIPTMLRCLKYNIHRQAYDLKLFELRNTFRKDLLGEGVEESKTLCLALVGKRYGRNWALSRDPVDFYDGKGYLEGLWKLLRLPPYQLRPVSKGPLHPGKSAELWVEGQKVGEWGFLHPFVAAQFEIEIPIVIGELNLKVLWGFKKAPIVFKTLVRFPAIERDLTVVVPEALTAEALIQEISKLKIPHIRGVKIFDIYRGNPIEEGKKALTYAIRYQDPDRTLTDEEVNQIHTRMVETLKTILPIEWR